MGLIDGKVAIVTGAGRGIGRAVAELMAEQGASVVVNDLDESVANETVSAIRASGAKAEACAGSVTDARFPARLVATAIDAYGTFDIIVNNAGYTFDGMIHKMSDEQWQAMLDCHLTAPFRILREASLHWREWSKAESASGAPKPRKVVNVSSTSGGAAWPAMPDR
jgi:3-oxoacyl-[acyl-carrier protein] reductase